MVNKQNKQTDRQTVRQRDRQTVRQRDRQTDNLLNCGQKPCASWLTF